MPGPEKSWTNADFRLFFVSETRKKSISKLDRSVGDYAYRTDELPNKVNILTALPRSNRRKNITQHMKARSSFSKETAF